MDTHTFLWWNTDDPSLSDHARTIISDPHNEVYLSAASVWEIAIKAAKGRLVLPEPAGLYITTRMDLYHFLPVPILVHHAAHVYELPPYHSDPFDRILVAQSWLESLPLLTRDEEIQRYDVETIW
jgi:PIN domain nuclease of toxin-antitoxin system